MSSMYFARTIARLSQVEDVGGSEDRFVARIMIAVDEYVRELVHDLPDPDRVARIAEALRVVGLTETAALLDAARAGRPPS